MIYILPYTLVDQYNEFEWKKKIKQKRLFDITAPSFWYLHGAIERHFHYDGAYMFVDEETKEKYCTEINGLLTLNEGIYDVTVEQYSEQYGHPCKAYIFHRQSGKYTDMRGYVVDTTDKGDVEDAESRYNKRATWM